MFVQSRQHDLKPVCLCQVTEKPAQRQMGMGRVGEACAAALVMPYALVPCPSVAALCLSELG